MSSSKTSHLERTAAEPRDKSLNIVKLQRIEEINETTRLFRLEIPASGRPIRFLPGQWLDVFVPGIPKAGGFTITSPPSKAQPRSSTTTSNSTSDPAPEPGYLELAIQKSPENPPAAWLWQDPAASLIGKELQIRVGGSFVWPPPGVNVRTLRRVVFVAGGVGINPLISMLSDIAEKGSVGFAVSFLYSLKDPGPGRRDAAKMLFLERLHDLFKSGKVNGELRLFLTGGDVGKGTIECGGEDEVSFEGRRLGKQDLEEAVGHAVDRRFTVVYVCGLPTMTDEFVEDLTNPNGLGMAPHTVLREKWW
ncbi:putative NADH-cytochrome b-5 reductase [Seiridium unicorne]|uniref:NADH-cytochrome b-5 reductase n=1 Tax=Seiridium unicorne TaxID=138068 RepID=A0ABR2UYN5_9PEZI